jgi:hypothetical protein
MESTEQVYSSTGNPEPLFANKYNPRQNILYEESFDIRTDPDGPVLFAILL